ncbi:MAG: hypothetical protein U0797_11040 [Gemmataceae bacterium]
MSFTQGQARLACPTGEAACPRRSAPSPPYVLRGATPRTGNSGGASAALRRRLRFVATFRGTAWLLACVAGVVVVTGLLDYRLHLPALARAFALAGLLTSAGLILFRFLIRPLAVPTDDLSLALRIEERYPLLNDSLASTVQFLQRVPPSGESASMRGEAVRRALARIDGLDFGRVVDARGLRAAGLSALLALAAVLALATMYPLLAVTAAARLAHPFGATDWPKKTRIDLDKVVLRIGRNREYRLRGQLFGVVPPEVTAEVTNEGFPTQRKTFAVHPEEHTFTLHLKPEEIQRNFRFRVLANDAATPEFAVEVLPLPILVPLDGKPSPQLLVQPPAYTDLPATRLPPGQGNLEVVPGTVVTFRAAADRPLRRAWIEYQPEQPGTAPAACLAAFASQDPIGTLGAVVLSRAVYERIPAKILQDPRQVEVVFRPSTNGSYGLHFEDEHELENSRSYELRLRLDPAPAVKLERPSPTRDVLSVLPTAELPLSLIVEDQQFAVRSSWLEYRVGDEPARAVPLFDAGRGIDLGHWGGPTFRGAPTPRLRARRLEFDRRLALRLLRHADGSPLRENDVVLLQAFADDFDDVSVGKEPGKSHQVTIRIVGREALDNEVNREQARIQSDLVKVRDKQREALQKVKDVEARVRRGGKMVPEREAAEAEVKSTRLQQEAAAEQDAADNAKSEAERRRHRDAAQAKRQEAEKLDKEAQELRRQAQQLAEAEQLQQQIRERFGDDKEGLRAEIERVRDTLRQNNMENTNAMERMSRLAKELNRLAGQELEHIEPRLNNARKLSGMQDEKAREERRAELEKRAKAAEAEAKAAEERAKKANDRAAEAEKDGQAEEAARAKKDAAAQQQKAAERRAEAERDRQDAAAGADPEKARRSLADARRGQEEVERSLSQLLQEMEPWSSTLEVNNEASRLLQEQKELQAQLDDLAKKGTTGKSRDELTEAEKADLDAAKEAQSRLQERAGHLLQQMKKLAEARAQRDAETANDLKRAAEQAEQNNLQGQMKDAADSIGRNELNQARKKQQEAAAELEKLVKNLKDSREARLDRLGRKLREAEEMVERLMDEQEKLQRKLREAEGIKDPKKRDEELKRLAAKQQELRRKTEEAIGQLSRLGNDRARQSLQEANEDMADAVKQLSRGKKDDEKQEDILDRLEEARREIERARKKAEEELGREQLVRVADVLRRIRERHEGHIQEAKRIQDEALQRKGWSRGLKASLRDLGQNQQGLSEEAAGVAKKDLTSAPVFARLVERAARSMEKAGQRLAAMVRESPPLDAAGRRGTIRAGPGGTARLDQLLASLKESIDDPRPLSRDGGEGGEGGGGGGGGGGDDGGLPPTAQLKLLRSLQKEVNDRTAEFTKRHPALDALDARSKAELQEVRREQKEVADLLDRLTRSAVDDEAKVDDKARDEGEKP